MQSKFLLPYTLRYKFDTILDIGPGATDEATMFWLNHGKKVYSIDIKKQININHVNHNFIVGDFINTKINLKFDSIYASHVLEHIQDTGMFLHKCRNILRDDGIMFIVVPPLKHEIVGGHVHLWNMGLLMYNLILSGFNVRDGRFVKNGYNIAGIVKKDSRQLPKLHNDNGDIEKLSDFFPNNTYFKHGFNGNMQEYNWFRN